MALGTNHIDHTSAVGSAAGFVPEIWEDEIVADYKQKLVLANLVSKINHNGRKGDTLYLPAITAGDRATKVARQKAEDTVVTLDTAATGEVTVNLNKHYYYSFLYEDLVALQGMDSLRQHYTDHASYALARQVDRDIFVAFGATNGGTDGIGTSGNGAVIGSDGATSFAGSGASGNMAALTDAGIRKILQTLDDSDNPMSDRYLVIPPVERNNLMGLARFTEQAFVGEQGSGNTIRNGMLGQIYGVGVYITTNCPYMHVDSSDGEIVHLWTSTAMGTGAVVDIYGTSNTVTTDGGVIARQALMFHRDAVVFAEQQSIRAQSQNKLEYLGDLFVADCVYGVSEKRDYAAVPIAVLS